MDDEDGHLRGRRTKGEEKVDPQKDVQSSACILPRHQHGVYPQSYFFSPLFCCLLFIKIFLWSPFFPHESALQLRGSTLTIAEGRKEEKRNPIGLDQRTWCSTDINSVLPPPLLDSHSPSGPPHPGPSTLRALLILARCGI